MELLRNYDYESKKCFQFISKGKETITDKKLQSFLSKNKFVINNNRDIINAIFRRIELIVDQEIDYAEFLNLTTNQIEYP